MARPLSADSRPRVKYLLPDGRVILVITDHGEEPKPMTTFEVTADDPLYPQAQNAFRSERRFVLASLAVGL